MGKKRIWIFALMIVAPLMVFAIQQTEDRKTQEQSESDIAMEDEKMDPEWVRGFNAAIRQFAPSESAKSLTMEVQKTKAYTSSKEEHSETTPKPKESSEHESRYAMGYHQALEMLYQGVLCPRQ
jgi:hypothetical protein